MERTKIITNIFKIHFLTYVFILISLFSGRIKSILLYMAIIIVHELGHYLTGLLFNWKVDKIYIYPLGGVTVFKDRLNKPFIEEFLVTISGPLIQIIIANYLSYIDSSILFFSNVLLMINLLPIVPLDGGKLCNIILSCFISYKKSMIYAIKVSFVVWFIIIYILIKTNSLILLISFILIIFKIIEEYKNTGYYYNRFLIERMFINYNGKNIIINNIEDIYKYRKNYININNQLYSEREYIERFLM